MSAQVLDTSREIASSGVNCVSEPTLYNGRRTYAPQLGAYTQMDPIGLGGGLNRRGYVEGNPFSSTDPTGEFSIGWPGFWFGPPPAGTFPGFTSLCLANPAVCGVGLAGAAGAAVGTLVYPHVASTIATAVDAVCSPGGPKCDDLNNKVQDAKTLTGQLGKCMPGMSRIDLRTRYDAWVNEGQARAKRDEVCWNGGDMGHQIAQAQVWQTVGNCSRLMQ